jgi:competence protein ComEC
MNDTPPRRPDVPVVAWFALALWAGSAVLERVLAGGVSLTMLGLVAAVAAMGAAAGAWRRRFLIAMVLVGLLAGGALSALQWGSLERQRDIAGACGAREWTAVVCADPVEGQYGGVVRVTLLGGPLDGASVRVCWPQAEALPDLGRTVRFSAVLQPLPLEEVWARRLQRSGVCASGTAWVAETGKWRPDMAGGLFAWRTTVLQAMHRLRGPGADLAEGIVLGDRRRLLGTQAEGDFQVLGLTHLVAVSGSHLALACGAVGFLGALMRLPKRVLVLATVAAGGAYAVVTGLPFSALRSLLMLGVVGLGQLLGRRGSGLASLSVAVVAVLALSPWAVFDLGLQLSVLAVASLLLFGSLATAWLLVGTPRSLRAVASPLGLTLVAQVATVPVVASAFGLVSVIAPVANAIAGALVSVALLLGLSGAVLSGLMPTLGLLLLRLCCSVLGATAWVAHLLAGVPGAAVAMNGGPAVSAAAFGGLALLWLLWPLPSSRRAATRVIAIVLAASLALAVGPAPPRRCTITVLDVGQGDAILVQDAGRTMLVDAGPDPLSVRQALARSAVRRIDALVLTHAHDDHTGGLAALPAIAEIGWVGISAYAEADSVGGRVPRALRAGDCWQVGDTMVRVLWPPAESDTELKTNDTSVVLQVSRGDFTIVLTGDAEDAAQDGMLADGYLSDIDVLKVPHHGSSNGLSAEALGAWKPELALISVGEGNDFGHPSGATLEMLRGASVRVLRTDQSGDLAVLVGDRGYRVRCARNGSAEAVRARMGTVRARCGRMIAKHQLKGRCGKGQLHRGSQARLSDLWRRGPAAGARAPPFARPSGRGCRPRLQLRHLQWRVRGRRHCAGRREHAAVRI